MLCLLVAALAVVASLGSAQTQSFGGMDMKFSCPQVALSDLTTAIVEDTDDLFDNARMSCL